MKYFTIQFFIFLSTMAMVETIAAQSWRAIVEVPDDREIPFCSAIQNGILQVPAASVAENFQYKTRFILTDTFFVNNQFTLEARIRNGDANGGFPAFDPGIYLQGCNLDMGASLMGLDWAREFTSMYAGSAGVSNTPNLVRDFSDWHVVKYVVQNNVFSLYYDQELLQTLPYDREIDFITRLIIRFKGSGQVDWVKLYDGTSKLVWSEEFDSCATVSGFPDWQSAFSLQASNDTTVCRGESVRFSATNIANTTYTWRGPNGFSAFERSPLLVNIAPRDTGFYYVTAQYKNCFSLIDSVYVRLKTVTSPSASFLGRDTTLCLNSKLRIGRAYPCASYEWQDGSTDSTFLVQNAGKYVVHIRANNQSFRDTIQVNYYALPKINLGKDTTLCAGDTLRLNAFLPTAATYRWQDGSNGSTFRVQRAGLYHVTVTDLCGNSTNDSIQINYYKILKTLYLGKDTTLCPGQFLSFNVADSAAIAYRWQDGSTNPVFTARNPGVYSVALTDNCGNVKQDSIRIAYYDVIQAIDLGQDTTLCPGEVLLLKATHRAAKFYRWQNGSSDSTFLVSQPGIYKVQVTDNCGNTVQDEVEVKYFDVIKKVNLGRDTSLCPGTIIVLNALDAAAVTYRWQDGSTKPNLEVKTEGIYTVTLTDHCNNVFSDSIQIAYYQLIDSINIGPRDTLLCIGETVTLNATSKAAGSYLWQDGKMTATYTVTQSGIYQIKVSDNCGNSASDEMRIRYQDVPKTTSLTADTIICENTVYLLNATAVDAKFYRWQDGTTQATYPVMKPGTYNVTVGNACGEQAYWINIETKYCGPCRTYVPGAFSPNGDGTNDRFEISSECVFTHYEFQVFNRWGAQVFKSISPWQFWEGTLRGSELPNGVYVWQLRYKAQDGSEQTLIGDVLLMR